MTTTKDGNAVLLPEEDYSGIVETLYLVSVPGMREKLMAAKAEPLEVVLTNRLWNGSHQDFKPLDTLRKMTRKRTVLQFVFFFKFF